MGRSRLSKPRLYREDYEQRLRKAVRSVLPKYALVEQHDPQQPRRSWKVYGGKREYVVAIWQGRRTSQGIWSRSCTCDDFTTHAPGPTNYCKHILAVILKHPDLSYLMLDVFV